MKNYFNLFIIFSLLSITLTACRKEKGCTDATATNYYVLAEEDDGSCIYPVKLMQAKVNNSLIVCDSIITAYQSGSVNGGKKGGKSFEITLPVSSGIGTYQFLNFYSGTMCEAFYTKDYDFNDPYHSRNGSVTITSYTSKNVKGNFNFFAVNSSNTDSLQVSEGSFDIDF